MLAKHIRYVQHARLGVYFVFTQTGLTANGQYDHMVVAGRPRSFIVWAIPVVPSRLETPLGLWLLAGWSGAAWQGPSRGCALMSHVVQILSEP